MRVFRFHIYVHIFNLLSCLLGVAIYVIMWKLKAQHTLDIILLFFSAVAFYNFISYLCSYYEVNEEGLIKKKNMFSKQIIKWEEIEHISVLPTSKGTRYVIGVYGLDKEILVSYWVGCYRDLMRLVIENCSKKGNNGVKVDPLVIKFVEG